jgi:hypothetical protein
MKLRAYIGGAALAASLTFSGAALAQPYGPRPNGEAELQRAIGRLSATIAAIRNDRHEDGGYRVRAIADMERAQEELRRAIEWDRGHGGS